jgi:hypothetical protein
MNTIDQASTGQSDDVEGHATINVNETVDTDDDTEGHGLSNNVNETVDTDEQ